MVLTPLEGGCLPQPAEAASPSPAEAKRARVRVRRDRILNERTGPVLEFPGGEEEEKGIWFCLADPCVMKKN